MDAVTADAASTDAPLVDECDQLAPGADATTDTWSVVDQDRTLPAWLPGDASREVRIGLDGTVDGTDCMCNWGVPCPGPPETMRCTLGTAARLGPSPTCGTPNGTQDEPAAFLAAFGERP